MKESIKFNFWRWLGSMFTDTKVDPNTGKETAALSLTRVLATLIFGAMLWLWLSTDINTELIDPIPDSMLYTFWSLLGLKGVNKITETFKPNGLIKVKQ